MMKKINVKWCLYSLLTGLLLAWLVSFSMKGSALPIHAAGLHTPCSPNYISWRLIGTGHGFGAKGEEFQAQLFAGYDSTTGAFCSEYYLHGVATIPGGETISGQTMEASLTATGGDSQTSSKPVNVVGPATVSIDTPTVSGSCITAGGFAISGLNGQNGDTGADVTLPGSPLCASGQAA
jgi:hypothetical protein